MHIRLRNDPRPSRAMVRAWPEAELRWRRSLWGLAILTSILFALAATAPRAFAQDGEQNGPPLGGTKQAGPALGVMVRDIPFERLDSLALGHGVEVAGVIDDSPASKAEIAPGDVLVTMGGLPLYSAERLKWLVSKQSAGQTVALSIHRRGAPPGELSDVSVTLAPDTTLREETAASGRAWLGIQMQPMTDALRAAQGVPDGEGVLVADVVEDSPAAQAGLAAGDVITRIDRRTIRNPRDVYRSVDFFDPGETVEIAVSRDGESRTLNVTLGETPAEAGAATDMFSFPGPWHLPWHPPGAGATPWLAPLPPEWRSRLEEGLRRAPWRVEPWGWPAPGTSPQSAPDGSGTAL
jgi:membrane-associated protease RseP (regulator of RpoE activity)